MATLPPDWALFVTASGIDWDGYDEHLRLRQATNQRRAMLTARAGVVGLLAFLIWWL